MNNSLIKKWGIRLFVLCLLGLLIFGSVYYYLTDVRHYWEAIFYDYSHQNNYVSTAAEIAAILEQFKSVALKDLPEEYRTQAKLDDNTYRKMVRNTSYYKIKKKDVYRKIVGDNRMVNLVTKDSAYYAMSYWSEDWLYWGIDKRILFKILALQDELTKQGYDRNAFYLKSGHRSPWYNEYVKGASKSRHILGQAVDIQVGDINRSGGFTAEDKVIVIQICEDKIIGNKGGIGLYPGTRAVHIDVRGYKARWNSY